MRARLATLILAAATIGGCAYPGVGTGVSVSSGYGGYGYNPYSPYGAYGSYGSYGGYRYNDPYGYYGYNPYRGYGGNPYYVGPHYGSPYGWYNGFYYPGTGYYVYDRDRRRREMNEAERRHWMQRIAEAAARKAREGQTSGSTTTSTTQRVAPNWSGFNTRSRVESTRVERAERARARLESRESERRAATSRSSSDMRSTIRRRLSSDD